MIIPAREADTIRQALLKEVNPGQGTLGKGSGGSTYTFNAGSVVFQISGAMGRGEAQQAAAEFKRALQSDQIQTVASGRRS